VASHCLSCLRITCVGHVTVKPRSRIADEVLDDLLKLERRLDIGVAEAEIEDVLAPMDLFEPIAFFEHAPNPGGALAETFDLLGRGHASSPVLHGIACKR
jgi:hypothetical protein